MSCVVIEPVREKADPLLVGPGLFVINPAEASEAARLARLSQGRQHFLYNSKLFQMPSAGRKGSYFLAGPAVGASMAVMALEKLIALGARQVIVYGWCGSLIPDLAIGDILLPAWGMSEEGTSAHYQTDGCPPQASPALLRLVADRLASHSLSYKVAPMWTTDAPYRETVEKVEKYGAQGIMGVDMEFSALATVAAFRNIELAAVMLVSDELWRRPWRPGFRRRDFKQKSKLLLNVLMDCCQTL